MLTRYIITSKEMVELTWSCTTVAALEGGL